MKKLILYLILILACFNSCIQVIDRVNPIIADFTINKEYTLQDTICITTTYSDNERLSKILIQMNFSPVGTITNVLGTQIFFKEVPISLSRGGRRFDGSTCFAIPVDTSPGDYSVTVTVTDASNNSTRITKYTKILPDQIKPVVNEKPKITIFKNNVFVNLVPDSNGFYTVCQLDILNFNGQVTVADNQAIKNITASVTVIRGNREVNVFTNSTDLNNTTTKLVRLENFFVPAIRLADKDVEGNDVTNNSLLKLRIIATDFAGNTESSIPLDLKIDCDRVAPIITVGKSRPQLDSLKSELVVVEKGNFRLLRGTMTDNKALANLNVVFKKTNGTTVLTKNITLTGTSAKLEEVLPDIFSVPTNAAINDEYQLILTVTDNSGNQTLYILKVKIKVDDPPLITIIRPTIRLSNGTEREVTLSTDAQNPTIIPLDAQSITIQGKVTDDNFLDYIQQFFVINGTSTQLVDAKNLQELVYDFTQAPLLSTFAFPNNRISQSYQLEIRAKDNKVEVKKVFYIRTQ